MSVDFSKLLKQATEMKKMAEQMIAFAEAEGEPEEEMEGGEEEESSEDSSEEEKKPSLNKGRAMAVVSALRKKMAK